MAAPQTGSFAGSLRDTTGERLAQIALVLGVIALLRLVAGVVQAFEGPDHGELVARFAGLAGAGVALECFGAAAMLRWSTGRLRAPAQIVVVIASVAAVLLVALSVAADPSNHFSAVGGYGLWIVAPLVLLIAAIALSAELSSRWRRNLDDDKDGEGVPGETFDNGLLASDVDPDAPRA
ncbi:MAG TPA: hypothetical protein VNB24_06665 [Acidimicrobiales bacterium]|nr:hypothetical protein [Acidimicrobiales bacterium]